MSPIVVNSSLDNSTAGNGQCTLREAIANANTDNDGTDGDCAAGSGPDLITFAPGLTGQTITLSAGELEISTTVTIQGPGVDRLAISGGESSRVFNITGSGQVTLSDLTVRDGRVSGENGGGIYNSGSLLLDHVAVLTNAITAGSFTDGGGIYNSGWLTVTHSAIISNASLGDNGRGGGVANSSGTAVLINSTVSGNYASTSGGGVINAGTALLTSTHSTIANNEAVGVQGGGIYIETVVTNTTFLKNTILADNIADGTGGDCYALLPTAPPVSLGYNLVENPNNGCNLVETGDELNQAPNLGLLQNNGGQTPTHALLTGSPANDAIPVGTNGCHDTITTDQRDYLRVGPCSMGALEYNGIRLTLTKSVDDDTPDPAQTITYTVVISLAPSGNVSVTNLYLTDTLPTDLNYVGPVSVSGGSDGATGTPPLLVSGRTLTGGHTVTVTTPVTVSTGLRGGTILTNSVRVTSSEVTAPITAVQVITVSNIPPVAVTDLLTISEDSDAVTITVLANDYDLNGDTITLTAVGSGDQGGDIARRGNLVVYTPTLNFNGTEGLSYTISDGSLSHTGNVSVKVTPVNDAPSFTGGPDQLLLPDAGPQTVSNWATNISAGPTDESGQVLTFTLNNDLPGLFSRQPAVDTVGELTFTPTAAITGSAAVTATLQDSGGTVDGGKDTSEPYHFSIAVVEGDELGSITTGGGALTYTNGVSSVVAVPGGAVSSTIGLVYDELDSVSQQPPTGYRYAGRLLAIRVYSGTILQSDYDFKSPVTLTLTYDSSPAALNYADETSLQLRRWNGNSWVTTGISVVDFDPANDQLIVTLDRSGRFALVGQAPVLGIAKQVEFRLGVPLPGSWLTYTLALSNSGILTATGVTLSDTMPTGITFGSWVVQGGAQYILAEQRISWGPQDIPPYTPITVAFTARISASVAYSRTTITNSVAYSSTNGGSDNADNGFVTTAYYPYRFPVMFKDYEK
jgi:uncharacterized repeat protein (TIGR01451 family)/CSLREA domain-containing protein